MTLLPSAVGSSARCLFSPSPAKRAFSLLNPSKRSHTNRIFDSVRQPNDLHTLLLLNAADNRSLITFWSASWCQTCASTKPLILQLIEGERVGEREGGLGFVEVMMDSTLIADLPITYRVSSMPTLLAFSRQEAQFDTRLVKPDEMRDREFLRDWLVKEAQSGGRMGGGGRSIFG
jgi:thiol-disulfide isomerase/thioredoxin